MYIVCVCVLPVVENYQSSILTHMVYFHYHRGKNHIFQISIGKTLSVKKNSKVPLIIKTSHFSGERGGGGSSLSY